MGDGMWEMAFLLREDIFLPLAAPFWEHHDDFFTRSPFLLPMEFHQAIQNRAAETAAVIRKFLPGLSLGAVTAAELISQSDKLNALAQSRDDAVASADQASNAANQGFLGIQRLTLGLPKAAEGDLDDAVQAESALLDLLSPVYAVNPRTVELALDRGKKLVSALTKMNAYLAAQQPARAPVTSGKKGVADLIAAMAAQPELEQKVEDRAADVSGERSALRTAAVAVDRLNKRFYSKLQGEARSNPDLAEALAQITTESSNLPGTLGIRSVLQGGTDNLHVLVSYDNGSFDGGATNVLEWQVVGMDAGFTHSVPVDPSGSALGPFSPGQMVNLRTRVTNANGTTTGSVRTLKVQ